MTLTTIPPLRQHECNHQDVHETLGQYSGRSESIGRVGESGLDCAAYRSGRPRLPEEAGAR